jgi:TonB family protein
VDSDLEDKIVRRPWARDPGRWFSSSDYPQHLILLGVEAEVTVRLLVDASGNVTKCTSLSHFNAPEFNKITCDSIMRRAHLEPAELADGTKVPSYYTKRIAFRIGQ